MFELIGMQPKQRENVNCHPNQWFEATTTIQFDPRALTLTLTLTLITRTLNIQTFQLSAPQVCGV